MQCFINKLIPRLVFEMIFRIFTVLCIILPLSEIKVGAYLGKSWKFMLELHRIMKVNIFQYLCSKSHYKQFPHFNFANNFFSLLKYKKKSLINHIHITGDVIPKSKVQSLWEFLWFKYRYQTNFKYLFPNFSHLFLKHDGCGINAW